MQPNNWMFQFARLEREPFINAMLESIEMTIVTGMPVPDGEGGISDYLIVLLGHPELLKNIRAVVNAVQYPIRVNAKLGDYNTPVQIDSILQIDEVPASRTTNTLILRIALDD